MAKRLREFVKYTTKELDTYTKTEGSCIRKVNTDMHLSMGPYGLADFKHSLHAHLTRNKVGYYDDQLDGIILDLKHLKVLGSTAAMRADDPRIHVNLNVDAYIFRPEIGVELSGIVKHISNHHVGVIIYRVFNAHIRFGKKLRDDEVEMDKEVKFRIRSFNLQNVFPYIEGELLTDKQNKLKIKKLNYDLNESTLDSGIEEKDGQELDELVSLIKEEFISEGETTPMKKSKKTTGAASATKRNHKDSTSSTTISVLKQEPISEAENTPNKKSTTTDIAKKSAASTLKRKGKEFNSSASMSLVGQEIAAHANTSKTKRKRMISETVTMPAPIKVKEEVKDVTSKSPSKNIKIKLPAPIKIKVESNETTKKRKSKSNASIIADDSNHHLNGTIKSEQLDDDD